jgi:hypothetical protein
MIINGRHTYLQDHDGNANRARELGASHFATSLAEKRGQVHAGLGSHVTLVRKEQREREKLTMTNLVYGLLLLASQLSLGINRFFFEEVANFVSRREEVVVTDVIVVAGGESSLTQMRE